MDSPSTPASSTTIELPSRPAPLPPQVVLDADALGQLSNSDAKALLDTIDSLRELQVGEIVSLPQIIVVGDQSSGKSSVLEAISRVRFPVDGDLCTRFATELVLRREDRTSVNVRIQFADRDQNGEAPHRTFQRSGFDKDALPDIIEEAKREMGVSTGGTKKFSKDILRVEIAGPDVYPLTLVDLPGFFHAETVDQDLGGKEIVDQLIESYMKQPKSIILAVVAANNQLANQVVLRQAKKHDPNRERTIGVITKPDLAGSGSSNERKYLDLVKGRESVHKLELGWYVLRNRSEEERTAETDTRDATEEAFFQTGAWRSISPANRGIDSLRKRLSKALLGHIRTSLPDLIQEIEENLRDRQEKLDRLGRSRSTQDELRSYLLAISEDFQRLARDAVEGRYSDKFFGDLNQKETKLRAILRNLNRAFDATLSTKGARWKIDWDSNPTPNADANPDGNDSDPNHGSDGFPRYLQPFLDLYDVADPTPITESALNSRLELAAAANQGKEFPGMPNAELVLQLFRRQSERWQEIAQFHLDLALRYTKAFVEQAFQHAIGPDEATIRAILNNCVDPFFDTKKDMLQTKLEELLRPYTAGYGLPLEKEFHATMSRRTLQRLADQVAGRLERQHPELFQSKPTDGLSRKKILQAVLDAESSESGEFGAEKVIDMMVAYYEMSLRTFVDNVVNLAVESCLVYDVPNILTPRKVDRMSADTLRELASESEEVQAERQILQTEADILREGLRKCQQHRPRESAVLPAILSGPSSAARLSVSPSANATPSPSPTPQRVTAQPVSNPARTPNQGIVFGKSQPPTPPAFATPPPANPPSSGGFARWSNDGGSSSLSVGSAAAADSNNQTTSNRSLFGTTAPPNPPSTSSNTGGIFGPTPTNNGGTSLFSKAPTSGSSKSTGSGGTSLFSKAPTSSSSKSTGSGGTSLFGNAPTSGSSKSTGSGVPSLFGNAPTSGSSKSTGFGGSSGFGSPSTNNGSTSLFGKAPTSGNSSGFGSPPTNNGSTSLFGNVVAVDINNQTTSNRPLFVTTAPPKLPNASSSTGGIFGAPPTNSGSGSNSNGNNNSGSNSNNKNGGGGGFGA